MSKRHPTDLNLRWCPDCKQYLEIKGNFHFQPARGYYSTYCRSCKSQKELIRRHKEDQAVHQGKIQKRRDRDDEERREILKYRTEKRREKRDNLTDAYVRALIPKSVIEFFRQKILAARTLREFKRWRKDYESNDADVDAKQRDYEEVIEGAGKGSIET